MTDLEITKLCAEAMGHDAENYVLMLHSDGGHTGPFVSIDGENYDPLHDDAQAMALVKKFGLDIHCRSDFNGWYVGLWHNGLTIHAELNRAICECVAEIIQTKK